LEVFISDGVTTGKEGEKKIKKRKIERGTLELAGNKRESAL
jgi:hypothetical protein